MVLKGYLTARAPEGDSMETHPVTFRSSEFDRINLPAYQTRRVVRWAGAAAGWLEPGEERAVGLVAERVQDLPVLDLGVGGGRTAPLLAKLSTDYRGIDYAPAMVKMARQRYPALTFLEMDARHLLFADASFGLAMFSYNGIDSVDVAGRERVLHEVHRVLRPDGYFVFSSLNRRSVAAARQWPDWSVFRHTGLSPHRVSRACAHLALGGFNRLRRTSLIYESEDIAVGPIAAYDFALVTLFVSAAEEVRRLRSAGFEMEAILEPDGTELPADGSRETDAGWYYYVARKPG
jgi:SAM-dependent methyltransferase